MTSLRVPPLPRTVHRLQVGDPHWRGFNYTGGPWNLAKGQPGNTYSLYRDGQGAKCVRRRRHML